MEAPQVPELEAQLAALIDVPVARDPRLRTFSARHHFRAIHDSAGREIYALLTVYLL